MIPSPEWRELITYPPELVNWVNYRPDATFYDLLEEAIDPEWLFFLAEAGGSTRREVALAMCGVARLCLPFALKGEEQPRITIEIAEARVHKKATKKKLQKAIALNSHPAWDGAIDFDTYCAHRFAIEATNAAARYTLNLRYPIKCTIVPLPTDYVLNAGIGSREICETMRKLLPFNRPPKPKGLTVWQRLATEDE